MILMLTAYLEKPEPFLKQFLIFSPTFLLAMHPSRDNTAHMYLNLFTMLKLPTYAFDAFKFNFNVLHIFSYPHSQNQLIFF